MDMTLTACTRKFLSPKAGAMLLMLRNCRERFLQEARDNLRDAIEILLEANRGIT